MTGCGCALGYIEEKLDLLLGFYKKYRRPGNLIERVLYNKPYGELLDKICDNKKLEDKELEIKFLNEVLKEDKLIIVDGNDITISPRAVLYQGYQAKKISFRRQANLQLVMTVAIAVGTALSGLYCLGKFLLWLYHHFCTSCN